MLISANTIVKMGMSVVKALSRYIPIAVPVIIEPNNTNAISFTLL